MVNEKDVDDLIQLKSETNVIPIDKISGFKTSQKIK